MLKLASNRLNGRMREFASTTSAGLTSPPLPATIAGLQFWFDAGTLGLSDGATVDSWTDRSGNGNVASQATSGSRPILKTNILNGFPVVRADGSNDYMTIADSASMRLSQNAKTIVAVVKINGSGNLIQKGTDDNSEEYRILRDSPQYYFDVTSGTGPYFYNGNWGTSAFGIIVFRQSTSGGITTMNVWNNNTAISGTTTNDSQTPGTGTFPVNLFCYQGSGGLSNFLSCDLAEIFGYGTALSTVDRQALQTYLATKYGITLS